MSGPATTPPGDDSSESSAAEEPTSSSLAGLLKAVRWGTPLLLLAYLLSGVTVVRSDEVALVLRFGALSGDAAAAQLLPGLHYVLPRPIDEVVRVKVKKVYELEISDLHASGRSENYSGPTIDPTSEGYALTGDQNIVQVQMIARYQIGDPVSFALFQSQPEEVLKSSVKAAAIRTMGEIEVDDLLAEGRARFILDVVQRAQLRLERAQAGIDLISIEVTDLGPPRQVQAEFEEVQNAFIDMETKVTEARRHRERARPKAQAKRNQQLRDAEAYAAKVLGSARGDAAAWQDLYAEYRRDPKVLRERLYVETIESALPRTANLRFVPPPEGRRYPSETFRLSISP
ncbi:MAG: FtsH protease activity modulator HflK [Deltaproteobacteria bacterium]|nr:FtsH protease activity modulator HflK [Deltaproteobacteria bacterium]HCH65454.1 FtsH protease activity modulator HflK [Deltaproteobacteria bacterium]